jgi:hypothetical protein
MSRKANYICGVATVLEDPTISHRFEFPPLNTLNQQHDHDQPLEQGSGALRRQRPAIGARSLWNFVLDRRSGVLIQHTIRAAISSGNKPHRCTGAWRGPGGDPGNGSLWIGS